uniref:Uncharacterized protein n=1 Tax=viral metagenome TaxID=1070528 RepID=A0A6H1ZEA5_9ZZZZ
MLKLFIVLIPALAALFTYLLGNSRKIEQLRNQIRGKEDELKIALAKNDSLVVSVISLELSRMRSELGHFKGKR